MSGYKRVNFYELCRLCATNREKKKVHIFEEDGRKMQLQAKIQACLGVKVCETDCLPKVVCSDCLRNLEESFSFRKRCVSSEEMLSSYFNNYRHTDDFKKSGQVYIKDIEAAVEKTSAPSINVSVNQNGEVIKITQSPIGVGAQNFEFANVPQSQLFGVTPEAPISIVTPKTDPLKEETKTFACEFCTKAFKRREHLYQHEKLHSGFRPFVCERCKKSFIRKEHLHRHMTCHSGQRNFVCHLCLKSFSRNDNLLKHKKTHDKKTGFKCKICGKQFAIKHYYVAHKCGGNT